MLAIGITCGQGDWRFLSHGLPCFSGQGGWGMGSAPLSFPALPPCQMRWFGAVRCTFALGVLRCMGSMALLCVRVWGACWAVRVADE